MNTSAMAFPNLRRSRAWRSRWADYDSGQPRPRDVPDGSRADAPDAAQCHYSAITKRSRTHGAARFARDWKAHCAIPIDSGLKEDLPSENEAGYLAHR